MNKDRLQKLAEWLETIDPDRFDMDYWGTLVHGPFEKGADFQLIDGACGTTACALGWATTIPEFRAAGLVLRAGNNSARFHNDKVYITYGQVHYQGETGSTAGAAFFDISRYEADYLFDPTRYYQDQEEETPIQISEVVKRIEKLLSR